MSVKYPAPLGKMEDQKTVPSGTRVKYLSPAKVNLFLKVLSKRPDGYHELRTLMQPVSLYDEIFISIEEGRGITVTAGAENVPDGEENLAWRAARLVMDRAGEKKVSIEINKKIPVGAGLGGGSSDAATTLMAVNALLGAGLSDGELMDLGAKLGSDVPFFILKGPALAAGRGEVLQKITLPELFYVLVNPGFHVSTAWVYGNLNLTKKPENNTLPYSERGFAVEDIRQYLENDLERVTAGKYPEISRLKGLLLEAGALGALMSGSGPTVFGVFSSEQGARTAFEKMRGKLDPKSAVFLAKGL